jgi:hypothetical protein
VKEGEKGRRKQMDDIVKERRKGRRSLETSRPRVVNCTMSIKHRTRKVRRGELHPQSQPQVSLTIKPV